MSEEDFDQESALSLWRSFAMERLENLLRKPTTGVEDFDDVALRH